MSDSLEEDLIDLLVVLIGACVRVLGRAVCLTHTKEIICSIYKHIVCVCVSRERVLFSFSLCVCVSLFIFSMYMFAYLYTLNITSLSHTHTLSLSISLSLSLSLSARTITSGSFHGASSSQGATRAARHCLSFALHSQHPITFLLIP